MTSETDLLPLPAYDIDTANHAGVRLRGYTSYRTRTYARANLAERDAEVEALRADVLNLEDRCTMLHGSAEYMRARAERLAEALLRYGRHEHDCATRHDAAHKDRPVCDCGLSTALDQENDDA